MILSDYSIIKRLESGSLALSPEPSTDQFQPASLDIRLGRDFVFFNSGVGCILDARGESKHTISEVSIPDGGSITIDPGEFVLGTTLERITMPDDLVARVEGRSSIGRLGLTVHVTAGFIDPGFEGTITLEIANLNKHPIRIYAGMRIAQLAFQSMTTPSELPYGSKLGNSKYQGQSSVTTSRIGQEL